MRQRVPHISRPGRNQEAALAAGLPGSEYKVIRMFHACVVKLLWGLLRHLVRLPFNELSRNTQRAFESYSHQLAARLHASLTEQPLHYILNGTLRKANVLTNLSIGEASQNAQKNISLAVLQRTGSLMILKASVRIG